MSALDIMMLLVLGGCAAFGFLRGFVQEVLSLLAWVLAVVAVRLFLAPVADLVGVWLGTSGGASILAFVLLFGVTFFVGKMIARRVGKQTRSSVLGPIDRVLGAGFGAIKGLIGATLVFLAFSLVYNLVFGEDSARPLWMTSARSYPLLHASGNAMSQFARESSAPDKAGPAAAN
ncbi:MAG: CvpA family protein [Sphingobium sp.]